MMGEVVAVENDVIIRLKATNFSSLSYEDKRSVLDAGRPTPELKLVKQNNGFLRKFNPKVYEKYSWLCGSSITNKLYCWPCLLFSRKESSVRSSAQCSYDDLNNLHTAAGRHYKTASHLTTCLANNTFGQTRINVLLDNQKSIAITKHNEQVNRNREILKRLIRATCFLGIQEIPFRGHDESENSSNRENYIELAYFLAEFDEKMQTHLETATAFKGLSPDIQNDLIDSVGSVILAQIKTELQKCIYVSVLLDETSDVSCYSQLSTVIRYVNSNGAVCESFIRFSDVSKDRSATAISDLVVKELQEFYCLNKLIAQTYDGAAVMSGELNGVQAKVKEHAPDAIFIHCYAHRLNLVLSQAASSNAKCNVFFSTLGGLSTSFTTSSKRMSLLDDIVKTRFPKLAPTRWSYSAPLVETVQHNLEDLLQLFEHIVETPQSFDQKSINEGQGFLLTLSGFDFNILL